MSAISDLARFYFSRFPVEKGKWRIWERFRVTQHYRAFRPGPYRTRFGFSMNLAPDQQIDRFIYFWGCWEPNETWLIRRLIRSDDVFVDVGANDGYFSLLASGLVGPSGRVLSLEPLPPTVAELKANVVLNGFKNISIIEKAVSDRAGDMVLTMPDKAGTGMVTLRRVNGMSWRVGCDRLDHMLTHSPVPRLIKIDVEGAELKALRGLEGLLVRDDSPYVLCEVTRSYLEEVGDSTHDLYSWMARFGYEAYLLTGHGLRAQPKEAVGTNDQESILFAKRGSLT